jgi:DNA-binding response OmpR family regulator
MEDMSSKTQKTKSNKTILLVEDEEDLREIYKTKFILDGYKVITAKSGLEAIDLALHQNPDLILLDVILPQKSGFDVLEELKSNPKTKNVPVVILSNLGQDWEVKKGVELGAVQFLTKANFTPKEVVKIVEDVFKK